MIRPEDLLRPTPAGLYCPVGNFHIDPVRKVDRAVITHAHADHARSGHDAVLATAPTLDMMEVRYGEAFAKTRQPVAYGDTTDINGVTVSLAPAGHVLGSGQAVVEYKGLKMVCTGDYKRRPDPTCALFEPVKCDVFITEATFALPVFRHPPPEDEIAKLLLSVETFPERAHFIGAYSLGKAQRVIALLRAAGYDKTIWAHKSLQGLNAVYAKYGVDLGDVEILPDPDKAHPFETKGTVVIGPSQTLTDKLARMLDDPIRAFASGWMRVRARAKASGIELPMIISDHADWDELTETAQEISPDELWITHGREEALVRWAQLNGLCARPLKLVGYDEESA